MEFTGDFETHLTVDPSGGHDRLVAWADAHGLKCSTIVLDRGASPDQPMITLRGKGTVDDQLAAAQGWVRRIRDAGFTVVRVKVEASPFNRDVPQTADAFPAGCYFEHHLKLVLASDAEAALVGPIAERHAAHLSRNARRVRADGRRERFVTQRCRDVGLPGARTRLDALVAALTDAGFPPVESEAEFVVVDDRPDLDRGWIDG